MKSGRDRARGRAGGSNRPRRAARAAGVLAALPWLLPVAPASGADGPVRAVSHAAEGDVSRAMAYWTPGRMASATPVAGRGADVVPPTGAPDGVPAAQAGSGSRVVGALFFQGGDGDHYCTASVVRSAGRSLLLTAAHCLYDPRTRRWHGDIVFVPKYSAGARPYGTWPVRLMVADRRWTDDGDPDADVGFAVVRPVHGRRLADVVGGNWLLIGQGYENDVTVIGYPAVASFPADQPIWCVARTFRQAAHQMGFDCAGFYGGTSGSPWIVGYDDRTESGYVIGTVGGYQRGGIYDWRSYSPVFGRDVARLAETADART
ncbi:MAG TPA: hypothetical protein VF069_15850 [Streptosporangiaceae bacterium]